MTQSEFERLVEASHEQHPFWFEGYRETPTTQSELFAFETRARCTLPVEYKYFATRYGCGDFAFTNILSVRDGSRSIARAQCDGPDNFMPISENGCGDYYGFMIEEKACNGAVYFADHEEDYKISATEYGDLFEYIAEIGLKP